MDGRPRSTLASARHRWRYTSGDGAPPKSAASVAPDAGESITASALATDRVARVAEDWVHDTGWQVVQVQYRDGRVVVRALGPLPAPSPKDLRRRLDRAGEAGTDVALELVPEERVELPGR